MEKLKPFKENLSITISEDLKISKDLVAVYILGVEKNNNFIPLYIGQSSNYIRRLNEYLGRAKNKSDYVRLYTDSRGGRAIKHIIDNYPEYKIMYKIETCNENNKKKRETELISFYKKDHKLLNDVQGLKSKDHNDVDEKDKRVTDFIDSVLKK